MQVTFEELVTDFATYGPTIDHLLQDMNSSKDGVVYYNVDFCLLYEYLWNQNIPAIPPFKPYGKIFQNLIENQKYNPKFQLVFTGPSFWELFDSFVHHVERLNSYEFSAKSYYKEMQNRLKNNDFSVFQGILIDSGSASRQLELLKEGGFNDQIKKPIFRASELIEKKKILQGIGEVVKCSYHIKDIDIKYKNSYSKLLERMLSRRIDTKRDFENKRFHFGVDSANIIATLAINSTNQKTPLFFLTEPYLRRSYCGDFGRNPLVPFFWTSLMRLKNEGYIDSEETFLKRMKENASQILSELYKAKNFNDMSKFLRKDIIDFYGKYLGPLKEINAPAPNETSAEADINFNEFLSDAEKFKKRFVEAKEELIEGARDIAKLKENLLGDEYCEMMDINEDPVVKKIRRTLGL